MANPFDDSEARNWFFSVFPVPSSIPASLATHGSGPFEENEFDDFLRGKGINPVHLSPGGTSFLIVGRSGWDHDSLRELRPRYRSGEVRVYSQESFLMYFACCCDPALYSATMAKLSSGHSALEYLAAEEVRSPNTEIQGGGGEFTGDMPDKGMLRALGYHVGSSSSLTKKRRHHILDTLMRSNLPTVNSPAYTKSWATPHSTERLQKLFNTLAAFARNGRRRGHSFDQAVAEWESDIAWLRSAYNVDGSPRQRLISCPNCQNQLRVPAGRNLRITCPECFTKLEVAGS